VGQQIDPEIAIGRVTRDAKGKYTTIDDRATI